MVSLYPNPNTGNFQLTFNLNETINDVATISVSNVLGQIIYTDKIPVVNGKLQHEIALDKKSEDGFYSLNIVMKDRSMKKQFIVQH